MCDPKHAQSSQEHTHTTDFIRRYTTIKPRCSHHV